MKIRKRVYDIIEKSQGDFWSSVYDYLMIVVIVLSILPITFKSNPPFFHTLDLITTIVFIVDYLLRLWTADLKLKKGVSSFFCYPFTFMALVDLVCILPFFTTMSSGFRLLKVLRLVRALKVLRAVKFLRYSRSIDIIINVIKDQKEPLEAVCTLAFSYVVLSALLIFTVEPDSFRNFFDAIYWATVSLTTVGYGDIYPVSTAGRIVTMISSVFGIAIIALPAGIITAGYMARISKD